MKKYMTLIILAKCDRKALYYCYTQGLVDLWVMGIYGDLFSPGTFIINPL